MDAPLSAYTGNEPYVFVCYAHEDKDVVYPEMAWLHEQGVNLWYDEGISAGKNWRTAIGDSLLGANHVLFYVSAGSLRSDHCNREINLALDEGMAVVPVYLEDVELTTDLKVGLNRVQALHRNQDNNYQQHLLNALGQSTTTVEHQSNLISERRHSRIPQRVGVAVAFVLLVSAFWWLWPRMADIRIPAPTAVSELPITSIAVLPFTNMSNDPEQEFFSDGVAEDILNGLAKRNTLTVRPRSSSFALKEASLDLQTIGRRLNVTHVLEGSVRRSGGSIRVTVQLSDVGNDRSVWSQRYDRELTDVFAVQDAVVAEVLSALNVQLGSSESTRYIPGIEAYDAFLLGRDYYSRSQFDLSDQWLKTAVELDPSYADAWAFQAQNIAWRTAMGLNPSSGIYSSRRRQFIETALELDPSNPTALGTRALAETLYTIRDYEGAVHELVRLVTIHPNNESAHFSLILALGTIGRIDLAGRVAERLAALSPESMLMSATNPNLVVESGTLEAARVAVREYQTRFDYPVPRISLSMVTGDAAALQETLDRGHNFLGSDSLLFYSALVPYLDGDFAKAREIVSTPAAKEGYQPYYVRSRLALIERDLDAAFDYYYSAIEDAEPGAIQSIQGRRGYRRVFPEFYSDPRYAQMLKDYKLDPESVARMQIAELPF